MTGRNTKPQTPNTKETPRPKSQTQGRRGLRFGGWIFFGVWSLVFGVSAHTSEPTAEQVEFFEKRIRPIFAEHCYSCHSDKAEKVKGGLRLDTREALRKGGSSGAVIVPGDPDASPLIQAVRYQDEALQMPPSKGGGKKLSNDQIAALET